MQRVVQASDLADQLRVLLSGVEERGEFNGYGRRFVKHVDVPDDIADIIFAKFGLRRAKAEPLFGNFLGNHHLDGAFVHNHTDPAPFGFEHVRCNIALEMPEEGGLPVLDHKVLDVKRGDAWVCFASMELHGSTPTKGGQRLIASIGALVDNTEAANAFSALQRNGAKEGT